MQGVNRHFGLSFEINNGRASYKRDLLQVDIKDSNGRNFYDGPVKNNLITYDNTQKIPTGQGDDYTAGCLLDFPYFKIVIRWLQ